MGKIAESRAHICQPRLCAALLGIIKRSFDASVPADPLRNNIHEASNFENETGFVLVFD